MNKRSISICLLILLGILYFTKDYIAAFFITHDKELETKQIHFEEDYQKLKEDYDNLLNYHHLNSNNIISKVIMRDPLEFFDEVTILKGSEEQIHPGSMVINEQGLVGVVKEVNLHSSVVELLPNQNTKVAVQIGNTYGLLESENGILKIKNITDKEIINPNTPITTSDYSFLEGNVLVGTAKEIRSTNQNLSLEIIVEPAVNFDKIEYVSIKEMIANE